MSRLFKLDYIPDPDRGRPLFGAKIYVGVPNQDPTIPANQIQLTGDIGFPLGGVVNLDQPVRTNNGGVAVYNNAPVLVNNVGQSFAIAIYDKFDNLVYNFQNVDGELAFNNSAQEQIIGGSIYPEVGVLDDGMTVPSGTTHLRVLVDGKPVIVAMSPIASGVVSLLSETSATIGATPIEFVDSHSYKYGFFNSVFQAVQACDDGFVEVGQTIETSSYYNSWAVELSRPMGGNKYVLLSSVSRPTEDGGNIIYVGVGDLYLQAIWDGSADITQFGAKPIGGFDNHAAMQAALNFRESAGLRVTSPAGVFEYQNTLLLNQGETEAYIGELVGNGSGKTFWRKTTNNAPAGLESYHVDAFMSVVSRTTPDPYSYKNNVKGIYFDSSAPGRHDFGSFCEKATGWVWSDVDMKHVDIGFYTDDAWLMELGSTRIHDCRRGFVNNTTGTSWQMDATWVDGFDEAAYDLTGLVYITMNCPAADNDLEDGLSTVYNFANCKGVVMNGVGAEAFSGDLLVADNSIIQVNGMRPTLLKRPDLPTKCINAINSSKVTVNDSDFLGLASVSTVSVENYDSTSTVVWGQVNLNTSHSNLPTSRLTRNSALSSKTASIDCGGFVSTSLQLNTGTWQSLYQVSNGILFLGGHIEAGNARLDLTTPYFNIGSISTSAGSPTTIGAIVDDTGATLTNLIAYVDVADDNFLKVRLSGPAFDERFKIIFSAI